MNNRSFEKHSKGVGRLRVPSRSRAHRLSVLIGDAGSTRDKQPIQNSAKTRTVHTVSLHEQGNTERNSAHTMYF